MRELSKNELDQVSGGGNTQVPTSGSNLNRQNGFFTGASLNGFDHITSTAFQAILSHGQNTGVSANGQTKPPNTVP